MKRAMRCLYILRSNVRQSVAKSLFHDELAAFDPSLEKHRRKCEMAMEAGGCDIGKIPVFSTWIIRMDDARRKEFGYDPMEYTRKSIAEIERMRSDAIAALSRKIRRTA